MWHNEGNVSSNSTALFQWRFVCSQLPKLSTSPGQMFQSFEGLDPAHPGIPMQDSALQALESPPQISLLKKDTPWEISGDCL